VRKANRLFANRDVEDLLLESDDYSDQIDDNISDYVEEESSSDSCSEDMETIDDIRSTELNLKNDNEEWKCSKNRGNVKKVIIKPPVVIDYNKQMNAVVRQD
jgi:hypothetical protein